MFTAAGPGLGDWFLNTHTQNNNGYQNPYKELFSTTFTGFSLPGNAPRLTRTIIMALSKYSHKKDLKQSELLEYL